MAGGRLSDIFGHKNILLFGMTLFNAATLLCALINNQVGLLIGRAFQGAYYLSFSRSVVNGARGEWARWIERKKGNSPL